MHDFYGEVEAALHHLLDLDTQAAKDAWLARCRPEVADFIRENYDLEELATHGLDTASGLTISGAFVPGDVPPPKRTGQLVGGYHVEERMTLTHLSDVYRASKAGEQDCRFVIKFGLRPDSRPLMEAEYAFLCRQKAFFVIDPVTLEEDEAGTPYMITSYVHGNSLDTYFEKHSPDRETVLNLFGELCKTVANIHNESCVHRDLKPNNVVVALDNDTPYPILLDFGIAASLDPQVRHNPRIIYMGTESYAAPERRSGELGGVAADIYSLGVMLAEALTGKKPDWHTRRFVDRQGAPLPRDLVRVLHQCLAEDPLARYHSAYELAADLTRIREHRPIALWSDRPIYRTTCFVRRNTFSSALSLILVLGLIGGLHYFQTLKTTRRATDIVLKKAEDIERSVSALHRTGREAWEAASATISDRLAAQHHAVRDLQTYVQDHGIRGDAADVALGWATYQIGDYARAQTYLEKAAGSDLVAYPHYVTATYLALYEERRAGLVHFSGAALTRRRAEADTLLQKALRAYQAANPALPAHDRAYWETAFRWYTAPSQAAGWKLFDDLQALQAQYPTDTRFFTLEAQVAFWMAMDALERADDLKGALALVTRAANAYSAATRHEFCRADHHRRLAALYLLASHYTTGATAERYIKAGLTAAYLAVDIDPRDGRAQAVAAALLAEYPDTSLEHLMEARHLAETAVGLLPRESDAGMDARVIWMDIMGELAQQTQRPLAMTYLQRAAEEGEALMATGNATSAYALAKVKNRLASAALWDRAKKTALWREALAADRQAAAWDPDNPTYTRHMLFITLEMMKDAYDRGLDPSPDFASAKALMGDLGDTYFALVWFGEAGVLMGQYQRDQGGDGVAHFQAAEAILERARRVRPNAYPALKNLLFCKLQWARNEAWHKRPFLPLLAQAKALLPALEGYDRLPYYQGLVQAEYARTALADGRTAAAGAYLDKGVDALNTANYLMAVGEWLQLERAQVLLMKGEIEGAQGGRFLQRALALAAEIPETHTLYGEALEIKATAVLRGLQQRQLAGPWRPDRTRLAQMVAELCARPMRRDPALLAVAWAELAARGSPEVLAEALVQARQALDALAAPEDARQPALLEARARLTRLAAEHGLGQAAVARRESAGGTVVQ